MIRSHPLKNLKITFVLFYFLFFLLYFIFKTKILRNNSNYKTFIKHSKQKEKNIKKLHEITVDFRIAPEFSSALMSLIKLSKCAKNTTFLEIFL
jgi:hypothetical protein